MTPETLRDWLTKWAPKGTWMYDEGLAHADAWEFTLDDAAGMVRQLEADREQLREYGDEIVSLRTRLEAAEKALRYIVSYFDNGGLKDGCVAAEQVWPPHLMERIAVGRAALAGEEQVFTRKPYDPDLDEANAGAEEAVEAYLKRDPLISSVVRFPFGHKDIDLVYELDGVLYGAEVECRAKWWPATDDVFQWHPIRVPLRKLRLAQRYKQKMYYYGARADLRKAYTFRGDRIVAGTPSKIGPHAMGDDDEGFILIDGEVDYVDL